MKIPVFDLGGREVKKVELPSIFDMIWRPDIIRRAIRVSQSSRRQAYGTNKLAGKRTSAHYHGRRRERWAMMNRELARLPRLHGTSRHLNFRAAFAPQARGGRAAHPPKSEKKWELKINKKERAIAIVSAIAATANRELVMERGHRIPDKDIPFVIVDESQKIKKTKDLLLVLSKLGLEEELERISKKKVRAGKGKMRGRKYKRKTGPLIVITEDNGIVKAASNISGVDVSFVRDLNPEILAPGGHGARLTIYTESALQELAKMEVGR
jgi:large subunit ribosomal protein L4e